EDQSVPKWDQTSLFLTYEPQFGPLWSHFGPLWYFTDFMVHFGRVRDQSGPECDQSGPKCGPKCTKVRRVFCLVPLWSYFGPFWSLLVPLAPLWSLLVSTVYFGHFMVHF